VRILLARYSNADDFLAHYDSSFSWGGLALPTRATPGFEEPLVVEVSFPRLPNRILLRARAVDRDDRAGEPRLVVKFLPSELHKRDYVLGIARGEVAPSWARRHRRFPLRLPVRISVPDTAAHSDAITEDLCASGLFVRTPVLFPERFDLAIELMPETGAAVALTGRVAWVRNRTPSSGFGITLDAASRHNARALRRLLRLLKSSGHMEEGLRRDETGPIPPLLAAS
jgi:hypothetical protein